MLLRKASVDRPPVSNGPPSLPQTFLPFVPQHGQQLYRHIYLGCKEDDNVQKNYELLYTTLALITIELANEEVVIDLIRVAIALQVGFVTPS